MESSNFHKIKLYFVLLYSNEIEKQAVYFLIRKFMWISLILSSQRSKSI